MARGVTKTGDFGVILARAAARVERQRVGVFAIGRPVDADPQRLALGQFGAKRSNAIQGRLRHCDDGLIAHPPTIATWIVCF